MMKSRFFAPMLLVGALLAGVAGPLRSQAPSRARVLAFADTASVRIEVEVADARRMVGVPVRATITGAGDEAPLWSGEIGRLEIRPDGTGHVVRRVTGLRPRLWSPQSPHLYRLAVEAGAPGAGLNETVRFGFRRFESRDGRLLLNGRPVFLRGNAINPPERNLPDSLSENPRFAREYLRYLKSIGVNIIRLTRPSQAWFDVADEEGMMIFQGHYGTPKGGEPTRPPRDFNAALRWYKEDVIAPQVNHPSIVIFVLSNEQAAPEISYLRSGHQEVDRFLRQVHDSLRQWDDTRPYIGNAGYGFGRAGEICDLHRYWGWYYNSFLSFYTLRDPKICWRTDTVQPITLTENTGNYTGPDGRFNLVSSTKQPESQLNWTGHAPDAEQSRRALDYQAFVAGQAIEITRRLRARNPYLAGLTPFTILFGQWHGITGFGDMRPKPVTAQYARSYQPVLLSWELWTPQVYAGSTIRPLAHIVNDAETGEDLRNLTLHYTLADARGKTVLRGMQPMPDVRYYATERRPVSIALPASLPTGSYTLAGHLVRGADTLSRNETPLFVAARDYARTGSTGAGREVLVYDPSGATVRALRALGVTHRRVSDLGALDPARHALVLGAGAWDTRAAAAAARLRAFVAAGGRVLALRQDAARFDVSWLPVRLQLQTEELDHPLLYPGGRPYRNGMAVNPERPDHPVFAGLDRDRFFLWSDWTGWTDEQPGFPQVYPVTQGFKLTDRADLGRTAVLANYDHGLEGVALAEMFDGTGSVLLSGFDLVNRAGLDPVADRLLANLVRYTASAAPHAAAPLVETKIVWGDYASERGLVTGIYSGLVLHTVPVVPEGLKAGNPVRTDEQGFVFAGSGGGWNTRPAIQYVGRGRRPFGPYEFSLGGAVRLPKEHGPEGEGVFWARVPPGRRVMLTTVSNPAPKALELEIEVNGARQRHSVGAGTTARVETALPAGATTLGVAYRGDRRLVLWETDFQ